MIKIKEDMSLHIVFSFPLDEMIKKNLAQFW